MTKQQAIQLIEGIYWADTEGQCGEELRAAGRALVAEYGITPEEARAQFAEQDSCLVYGPGFLWTQPKHASTASGSS